MRAGVAQSGAAAKASMDLALVQARLAAVRAEVPVGAVVSFPDGTVLAAAGNETEQRSDPTAHAELLALRAAAARLGSTRLPGCTLYVTLEPCPMCAHAIGLFRIARLVFGAYDPKGGGVEHGPRLLHAGFNGHLPEIVAGVQEAECAGLLRDFFAARR